MVRQQRTGDLLFCQCADGNARCDAVKRILLPTCARTEIPPPSCSDVIERCKADRDCRCDARKLRSSYMQEPLGRIRTVVLRENYCNCGKYTLTCTCMSLYKI